MENEVKRARRICLQAHLWTLSKWAEKRATGEHDAATSLSMLKRKVGEIEEAMNKAGQSAAK
jgi:hypothetical protein